MSLQALATKHTIDVYKPLVTTGTALGNNRNFIFEKTLRCTVQPKDAFLAFDTDMRAMQIPHTIYFATDPAIKEDRRIVWTGVGNDMWMRVQSVPFNVQAASRLWQGRFNSRSADNPTKVLMLEFPEEMMPSGYHKVLEEIGPDRMAMRYFSQEEFDKLLRDAEKPGLRLVGVQDRTGWHPDRLA